MTGKGLTGLSFPDLKKPALKKQAFRKKIACHDMNDMKVPKPFSLVGNNEIILNL